MEVIKDVNDHTGMFSSLGRQCTEIFPILLSELLHCSPPPHKVKTHKKVTVPLRPKRQVMPFDAKITRQRFYDIRIVSKRGGIGEIRGNMGEIRGNYEEIREVWEIWRNLEI
jgi:hypothetical protein